MAKVVLLGNQCRSIKVCPWSQCILILSFGGRVTYQLSP